MVPCSDNLRPSCPLALLAGRDVSHATKLPDEPDPTLALNEAWAQTWNAESHMGGPSLAVRRFASTHTVVSRMSQRG